jgi:RNA-directed DNA polymerase
LCQRTINQYLSCAERGLHPKALEANLRELHERLKTRTYVAPPIKRVWIDKDNGKKRPIGLTEIEDKIVQKAVSMLMGAV